MPSIIPTEQVTENDSFIQHLLLYIVYSLPRGSTKFCTAGVMHVAAWMSVMRPPMLKAEMAKTKSRRSLGEQAEVGTLRLRM